MQTHSFRLLDSLAEVAANDWDALHDRSNPFLHHAFLSGLERHGCLRRSWGWTPRHAALYQGGALIAAAPGYLKNNSHGEFVFDHAWAQAYAHCGLDYYPKWLLAVPYTPVTGPRLLARDAGARQALLLAMRTHAAESGISSLHCNFLPEDELAGFDDTWLARADLQFHWRHQASWRGFDDFLAAMDSKKRKNIRQERERVRRAGVGFRLVHGDEAKAEDLAAMHAFYCATQHAYGNHPALTLEFLQHLAQTMPRRVLLILAERAGRTIAGALCLRGDDTLYGRYWGADETLPGLHFETCYYQGIDYCLREGLRVFEPGAQGEHKIARGFLPVLTHSRHFIADPRIAQALRPWCAEERGAVLRYREIVLAHSPFREPPADHPAFRGT
jgi:hypothetical protein